MVLSSIPDDHPFVTAPIPACEEARLATLRSLKVLDTLPEEDLDGIVEIARSLMDVPMALVSMIDRERQWFKAKAGLDVCETSRDIAFCAHAILQPEPLVIPDATVDPRFSDNPLVTGEFGLRFYAGAPIVIDGQAVGTVCCIDLQPRTPTHRQVQALAALARQAGALLVARRRAEAFAESERRFVAFLDNSPALAFLKDHEGRMRFSNRRHADVFGYAPGSIVGLRDEDRMPAEYAESLRRYDADVREKGSAIERDEIVPLPDGTPLVWHVLKFPIEIQGETWIGGMAVDVTAQRRAEAKVRSQAAELALALETAENATEAARHSAVRFEQLFDGLPAACFTYDAHGTIYEWNAAAETLWGVSHSESFLSSIYEIVVGEEHREAKREVVRRVFAGESVMGSERLETMRDGSSKWIVTNTFPLRSPSGEVIGAVSANLDITERKRMEQSIRESEDRLRTVLDSLHEGVVVQDAPGRVSLYNRSAGRILGIEGARLDLQSRRDPRSVGYREDGSDFPIEERPVARAIRTGKPDEAIIGMDHPSGERRWLSIMAVPLASPGGGPPETAVASFLDVTERMRMEDALREAKGFAESMAQNSTSFMYLVDFATKAQIWSNRDLSEILGHPAGGLSRPGSEMLMKILHPDDRAAIGRLGEVLRAAKDHEVAEAEVRFRHASGEWRWLWLRETVYKRDADGVPTEIMGTAQDVTERKRMETEVRDRETRFRTVVESLHEGLVVQDAEGRIVLWNRSAERILGLSGDEMAGRTSLDPRWGTVREDGSPLPGAEHPAMRALATGKRQPSVVMGVSRPDMETRWLSVNAEPMLPDEAGRPTSAVASFIDVTERIEQERRILQQMGQISDYSAELEVQKQELEAANARLVGLATTDGLTGLRNHRFFQDFLRKKIEQCQGAGLPISVVLLDVDRFKGYNDDFGHQAGDAVLRGVAGVLEGSVRDRDLAARYGGEEFVLVLPGLGAEGAARVAERAREALEATPFEWRAVTASFGVATLGADLVDAEAMIRAADGAMYRSKEGGRNRVTLAEPGALVPA